MAPIAPRSFEKNGMHSIVNEVYKAFIAVVTVVLLAALLTAAAEGQGGQQPSAPASEESSGTANRQIQAQLDAKAQRTPAQRKVSSQLLEARRAALARRQAKGAETAGEMVAVDIRADVTPAVLERIRALGGRVINSVGRHRAIRAHVPLSAVEKLAELDAVQWIRSADKAGTRGPLPSPYPPPPAAPRFRTLGG